MKNLIERAEALKVSLNNLKETKKDELLKDVNIDHIDIPYFLDDDITSFDELRDAIDDGNGFDVEIIYYSNAINYLVQNDPSLNESLSIASELGFTPDNLSSEILASLLASQNERNEFEQYESTFDTYFETIDEINTTIERLDEIIYELDDADDDTIEELEAELDDINDTYL